MFIFMGLRMFLMRYEFNAGGLSVRHLHLPKQMMGPYGPFFLFVSKWFSRCDRPSETR